MTTIRPQTCVVCRYGVCVHATMLHASAAIQLSGVSIHRNGRNDRFYSCALAAASAAFFAFVACVALCENHVLHWFRAEARG